MFHTVVAFNNVPWGSPFKRKIRLHQVVTSDSIFAADFAIWQVMNAEMIQPDKLHDTSGINELFYV